MGRGAGADVDHLSVEALEFYDDVRLSQVGTGVFVLGLDPHAGVTKGFLAYSRERIADGVVPVCGSLVFVAGESEISMRC